MNHLAVRTRFGWLLLLVLLPWYGHAKAPATGSLCDAGQTTYLGCQTGRHTTISLCGALPSTLQYRYRRGGHVELAFPANAEQGAQRFAFAHYSRYQTERTEISFKHGDADYTLFDDTEHGHRSAGVEVNTADGKTVEIRCTGNIQGSLHALGKTLRCDNDSALNGGQCP